LDTSVVIISWAVVALGFVTVWRDWHHKWEDAYFRKRRWLPMSDAMWLGYRRGTVVAQLAVICLATSAAFPNLILWTSVIFFSVILPTALIIVLFNRPRVIVPPGLRSEPGMLQDYWSRRRSRNDR
jgi:hypothetical protein